MREWMDVPGYEGYYQVSRSGQVRSLPRVVQRGRKTVRVRGRTLRAVTMKQGHASVQLCRGGTPQRFLVHRLVALAFIGPAPEGKPLVLHGKGGVSDNSVENLRWGTYQENTDDSIRDGTADFWGHSNRPKLACPQNHPYTGDNLYVDPRGGAECAERVSGSGLGLSTDTKKGEYRYDRDSFLGPGNPLRRQGD